MRKANPSMVWLMVSCGCWGIVLSLHSLAQEQSPDSTLGPEASDSTPFDPTRSYRYLTQICQLGNRMSGSEGMKRQRDFLEPFFTQLGAEVLWQPFDYRHPVTGIALELKNMVIRWNPSASNRFLLCAHYDTRPLPDRDPVNPQGLFVGANDGASGVALFMEMAHHMKSIPKEVGVDFVLFDGEELVYDDKRDHYFLGSTYFARAYAAYPESTRYECGVLVDMIADAQLQIYYETNSWKFAKPLATEVWEIAKELRCSAFEPKVKHAVRDDHLPLNQIAKIPVIDIIDFDYPTPMDNRNNRTGKNGYWHTTMDTPDKCSGESIKQVGDVLLEWLRRKSP